MAEKDIVEKILADYNDVFADIVNVLLFNGEEIISEDDLEPVVCAEPSPITFCLPNRDSINSMAPGFELQYGCSSTIGFCLLLSFHWTSNLKLLFIDRIDVFFRLTIIGRM